MLLVLTAMLWGANAQDARYLAQRATLRQERQAIQILADKDRQTRAGQAAKEIRLLIDVAAKAPGAWQRPTLEGLVSGLARQDPALAATLTGELAPLTGDGEPPRAERSAWEKKVDAARRRICAPLEEFCQRAVNAGVIDVAYDQMLQVLAYWPEHPDLHRNLGLQKVGDRWYGPRDLERVRGGMTWVGDLGWIFTKERKRYEAGDYFDPQSRVWTTLAKANAAHGTWKSPWILSTEHLEIRGTAPLGELVGAAEALERFYTRVFGAYANFFAPGGKGDLRLVFGLAQHPRLLVNIGKDEADYQAGLPPGTDAGWSAGMFIPRIPASFFYAGPPELYYHEFTHQILHVFSNGNQAPAWLCEGVAVYSQAPRYSGGGLEFGDVAGNQHLQGFIRDPKLRLPLARILDLSDQQAWNAATHPEANYASAGMLVQFCMEADKRAMRADFIDFLRDSYRGQTNDHPLNQYLGLSQNDLEERFAAWCTKLVAQVVDREAPTPAP